MGNQHKKGVDDYVPQKKEFFTKMVLLGCGESGKSTLFKHLKVLDPETNFYLDNDISKSYKGIILTNVVEAFQRILINMEKYFTQEEFVKKKFLTLRRIVVKF